MKRSNSTIIEELKLVLKHMDRIRESYRLEKEFVLEDPNIANLKKFRERSKAVYQMKIAGFARDIRRLRRNLSPNEPGLEEAEDLILNCSTEAARLQMHFTSTPNRLLRVYRTRNSEN